MQPQPPRLIRLPDGRAAFVGGGHTVPLSEDELRALQAEAARLLGQKRPGPSETKEA